MESTEFDYFMLLEILVCVSCFVFLSTAIVHVILRADVSPVVRRTVIMASNRILLDLSGNPDCCASGHMMNRST